MIETLTGIRFPASGEFRRDFIVPEAGRCPDALDQYDFHTLAYDAFYLPRKRAICLICPKLMNFEQLVRQGKFTSGGDALTVTSIWQYKRFAEVWLKCRERPNHLRFQYGGFDIRILVSEQQTERFRGLNCAVLKSKDNDLHWVRDWADYHVRVHGLQGVVFFDNGSSRYEPAEIDETLRAVPGMERVQVVSAPFSFGCKAYSDTMFLQVGILNIARRKYLSQAAGVLCTDLDELIKPIPQATIFSATRRSPLGYLLFRGRWRDLDPGHAGDEVRHSCHVYRSEDDACRQTKYCIDPRGLFRTSHWDVHGAVRGFLKNFMTTDKIEYWHCRQLTTNWKSKRGPCGSERLDFDWEAAGVFSAYFARQAAIAV
ncbi:MULTISPECIES: hypothetical protein [Rhodomicrobium]|uniref:hypothetical protein n=1 Tax=Rhodomicrobium TaxID=1068 RepID=UPI000F747E9F|nr:MULTISPECIES: hypothetical protein [Rhodomicrobium]